MSQILLTLRYDGTGYHGWQVQPNGMTVQQRVQDAIEEVTGVRGTLTGCSRTDTGVHARHFYCTTPVPARLTPDAFRKALNAVLPSDIAVCGCRTVPDTFHPRYDVVAKRYVYRLWNSPDRDPFEERYAWHIRTPLSETSLNETAQCFLGKHDFSAFCSAGSDVQDKVRTVRRSEVTREGDLLLFTVEADGFLYNMVRILVGTLIDVEQGRRTTEDIRQALLTGDRSKAGATAPPHGLFLDEVWYR